MVLVMLSSTTCLYFGAEDSLRTRYPRAENVTVWYTDREDLYRDHSDLHAAVVTAARSRGAQMQDLREYRSSSSALTVRNGVLQGAGGSISDAVQFTAIPLSDYNAAMGARLTLSPGQVYICHGRSDYRERTLSFPGGAAWQVKGLVDNLASGGDSASIVTQLTAIVPDEEIADMDRLMEGRTVFVIAHRLSTVRNSNAIIVLEHGAIVERGSHDELLAQKGEYYQLYNGMFELA